MARTVKFQAADADSTDGVSAHTGIAVPAVPRAARALELPRPPRLLLRFALYAGIALVLAALVGGWIARHQATARAERDVFADAKFTADRLGHDDLAHLALRRPVDGSLRDSLDELFSRKALTRGVLRVSLFSRDGKITYSTDHSLIGKTPYDLPQVTQALGGKTVHGVDQLRGGLGGNPTVLDSYVPVYWFFDKNSSPNGVIGVYRDHAPVAAAIWDDTLIQTGTIVLALLLLYLASFPILRAVMRRLAADNRLLVAQADALRVSEEQYRLIVETAAEGVCLLDADGEIVFANEKMAELVGLPDDGVAGRSFLSLVDEMSRPLVDARFIRASNGRPRELAMRGAGGQAMFASVAVNAVYDDEGGFTGALAMLTDITDRKRAEAALDEQEERLAVSPDAASGHRAGEIAHDFNNAVSAIAGYSEFLLANLAAGDPLRREAEQLRTALRGATGMTRQLLAFSRRETLRSGHLDLREVLARLNTSLPSALGRDIDLVVKLPPAIGVVEADELQIEQIVTGLALFAATTMPDGGRMMVEARDVLLDEKFARGHAPLQPGPYVLLAVKDNGRGLDEELKARLFHPVGGGVDETDPRSGLATVYGMVKQSNGFIWVESEPGAGSTFSVYLPRAEQAQAA